MMDPERARKVFVNNLPYELTQILLASGELSDILWESHTPEYRQAAHSYYERYADHITNLKVRS